jgi:nucleoside-diphosphate-sugar epimerase
VFGRHQDPASQYSAVIPRFITAMREGRAPTIFGSGEQSRDFTHIDDVVTANLLAMLAPAAACGVVNIACGRSHSLNTTVAILNRLLGSDIEPIHAAARPGDVERSWADISRATELLGYTPGVDFQQGLRVALENYEDAERAAAIGSAHR